MRSFTNETFASNDKAVVKIGKLFTKADDLREQNRKDMRALMLKMKANDREIFKKDPTRKGDVRKGFPTLNKDTIKSFVLQSVNRSKGAVHVDTVVKRAKEAGYMTSNKAGLVSTINGTLVVLAKEGLINNPSRGMYERLLE